MAILKEKYIVSKRNILNEIRNKTMSLQELRFFSIYLSKINPQDISTRVVRFPLEDFRAIMEMGKLNIDYLKNVTDRLLSKIIHIPIEKGGYDAFQLFKRCKVYLDDETEDWYMEIDAHDDALPLLFEFKSHYFSYELWNALKLKSKNQLHMYEILKQYEKVGYRIMSIEELRNSLGIKKDEYPRYGDFKKWVLDACQEALKENTDLGFNYMPHKKGARGKILSLRFDIFKNKNFVDMLNLNEFIAKQKFFTQEVEEENNLDLNNPYKENILLLIDACENEFSENEIIVVYNIMVNKWSHKINDSLWCFHYLRQKYIELNIRNEKSEIKHRFSYIKKIIQSDEEIY